MEIRPTDLSEPEVRSLLEYHHAEMVGYSPPGTAHVLDLGSLRAPDITVLAAWDGADLLAVGAMRRHDGFLEIKSMRAHPDAVGKGAGKAIVLHIINSAREAGLSHVRLETGSGALFDAAVGLYRSFGFEPGEAFAGYSPSDFNRFFHLKL
ncbi:GNAT family N-acetyltransferase [Parerythrobacter jejuensis]|uniref:GNAT family N-acetyltransferase n=1 Tax=Parerythrobacter jejuensis TaxID=795812 RepID=A0A845AVG1_9SPHN|nr:GNAT family N-acetyltransferase [Parerythrobacter jejuensis]MXP32476.1 GNAT family N-acetyltransferase [Parerythrobacter jejuensis]